MKNIFLQIKLKINLDLYEQKIIPYEVFTLYKKMIEAKLKKEEYEHN